MDSEALSLAEIIKLQTRLKRRFEKSLALAFSDMVGSATYFATHGDEAGRRLQQRHFDSLAGTIPQHRGRIVDTAGDGAFLVFPSPTDAALALIELQGHIARQNALQTDAHHLDVRMAIHWGPVLTDGVVVTGDSVNLCARIAGTASAGEIRLTSAAAELLADLRARCSGLPPATVKGIAKPVEIVRLEWLDRSRFPTRCRIRESGQEIELPNKDLITFGRLREQNGIVANDVVLSLKDASISQQVSRWHFELRRHPDGFRLRSVTDQATLVDGHPVTKGNDANLSVRSVVRVGNVLTIEFLPSANDSIG